MKSTWNKVEVELKREQYITELSGLKSQLDSINTVLNKCN